MKYSFIMPYFNRAIQLDKTLETFTALYGNRHDFEVIIIEDPKNKLEDLKMVAPYHDELFGVLGKYRSNLNIHCLELQSSNPTYSPVLHYNLGAKCAGQFVILTSPEVKHGADILSGFDFEFEKNEDVYVVCACESQDPNGKFKMWYQHTEYRDVRYHFCSALSRKSFERIGGFDSRFSAGYCFDDDMFKTRVERAGIPFVVRDDLKTTHQWHAKIIPSKHLWLRNEGLFNELY